MAAAICDCGLVKSSRKGDILVCDHCDTGGCDGACARCRTYKAAVARRLSQRSTDG